MGVKSFAMLSARNARAEDVSLILWWDWECLDWFQLMRRSFVIDARVRGLFIDALIINNLLEKGGAVGRKNDVHDSQRQQRSLS